MAGKGFTLKLPIENCRLNGQVRAQRGTCSITPARSIETIHARSLTHRHSSHFTTFLSYFFQILQFREKIKDTSLAKAEDIELLKWLIGENNSFF
jgi:hypothetical protein